MILHTIVTHEAIMALDVPAAVCSTVTTPHGFLETEKVGEEDIVRRLISTDPKAYLNPLYSPGTTFSKN